MARTSTPARSRGTRRPQPSRRPAGGRYRPPGRTVGGPAGRRRRRGRLSTGTRLALVVVFVAAGVLAVVFRSQLWDLARADSLTASCAVVVDASGSGDNFEPRSRLDSKLPRFLEQQACGHLDFVPLNGLSDASTCKLERLALDPPGSRNIDAAREEMRAAARKRAGELLECARRETPHNSDVLGALRRVSQLRPDGRPYAVLMVSDMVHSTPDAKLVRDTISTPEARSALIGQLAPLTPDLSGVTVFPTDLASAAKDGRRRVDVESFWTELLATDRAGHARLRSDYV